MIPSLLALSLILAVLLLSGACTDRGLETTAADQAFPDWRLTVNGTTSTVMSLDELRNLPSISGHGYCVSTTGIRFGPYRCKGVDVREIGRLAGGVGSNDTVWISAPDGYLWVFDSEQLEGRGFVTFDQNLSEITTTPLRIILMYEQDGKPLSYDDGGPARIAIISEEPGVITEGSAWVKWVDRIEIRRV